MGRVLGVAMVILGIVALIGKWFWSLGSYWMGGALIVFGLIAMAKGGNS